ncbi:MAG: PEP-CTERM sorting domain-containing protein [Pyrinomonadaceae bacterium]|jgi:hypothetical protein|nr:PEP-CTERM sorting domain-containing protein [Pyrinomonadaceae bacterium]
MSPSYKTIFTSFTFLVLCLCSVDVIQAAPVVVGGITFDDTAFIDQLDSSVGSFSFGGGASSVEDALVGSNPNDFTFCSGGNCDLTVSFTNNAVINLAGNDLAVFELGIADLFQLTIDGTTLTFQTISTGFSAGGFNLNVAQIDLSAFGVLPGDSRTSLAFNIGVINPSSGTTASLTVIGAINNTSSTAPIPEPATMLLLSTGLAGVAAKVRKRRNARKDSEA